MKEQQSKYPKAEITAAAGSMMGVSSPAITLDLIGKHEQDLTTAAGQLMKQLKGIDGIVKISSNQQETKPVYTIKVNPAEANTQQVAMQLYPLLNPTPIGSIKLDGKDTSVMMNTNINPASEADLQGIQMATASGLKPLSSIASIAEKEQSSSVLHKDGGQYIRISAEVDPE